MGKLRPRVILHGQDKSQLGGWCIRAVALADMAETPRQSQASPVRGAVDRAVKSCRINKSFQQKLRLTKMFLLGSSYSLVADGQHF